ncbi:MAG: PTS transporter subunit EIIC [Tepidanaerobacteraceae bacterium]|jgi:PTS system cellobiose-specific IIC component|nr:PTS transporter subunit EIIC [Tepidanaerobacteraceae bacterium]
MAELSGKFQDSLMVIAEKVDENKYLNSIKDSFTVFMPFVIVGSFATLFNSIICSPQTGLAKWIPALSKLSVAFTAMNFATLGIMSIPVIFLIAMNLARKNKVPEYIAGIVAVAAYCSVIPEVVTVTVNSATGSAAGIPAPALGAQGLFVGMLLTVVVVEFFTKLTRIEAIKITMPPSVPAGISTSFNTLIPILITLVSVSVFGALFKLGTGTYLNEFVYKVMQAPLEAVFQSPAGIIAIVVFAQLFWFLGIHGGLVISPIRNPLMAAAIAANIAAVSAGQQATQPVTYGFWMNFIVPGGAGMIFSLIIAILLCSKREDYRMIAKVGLGPSVFGISEPVVFGLPLVLNVRFAIPFIFNSAISCAIALFATKIGFMPCNTVDTPFGVPLLIGAFIGHGWQGIIVQIICIAVTILTWIPFVLMTNREIENN